MLLIGVGFGLSFPAFNMQATAGIANEEQGLASGLVNTSLQVGGAIGLAVATAVISANSGGATEGAALMDGFKPAIEVVTAISAVGLVTALTGVRLLRARQPELVTESD
jgi:sugar phosphate permease